MGNHAPGRPGTSLWAANHRLRTMKKKQDLKRARSVLLDLEYSVPFTGERHRKCNQVQCTSYPEYRKPPSKFVHFSFFMLLYIGGHSQARPGTSLWTESLRLCKMEKEERVKIRIIGLSDLTKHLVPQF